MAGSKSKSQTYRRPYHTPRRSQQRPRNSNARPGQQAFQRPIITEEDVAEIVGILKTRCGWSEAALRDFQKEALEALAAGRDVLLQAATGSGKTLVLAALHLLPSTEGMVTLCASPLIALQDEQVCLRSLSEPVFLISWCRLEGANNAEGLQSESGRDQ